MEKPTMQELKEQLSALDLKRILHPHNHTFKEQHKQLTALVEKMQTARGIIVLKLPVERLDLSGVVDVDGDFVRYSDYKALALSLQTILDSFESCVAGGNGELDDDLTDANTARKLLGKPTIEAL